MNTTDPTDRQAPQPQAAPQPERRYTRRIDCTPRERPASTAPLAAPSSDPASPPPASPR